MISVKNILARGLTNGVMKRILAVLTISLALFAQGVIVVPGGVGKVPGGGGGGGGGGDVTGPGSSTTNALASFAGTTGKIIKNNQYFTLIGNQVLHIGDSDPNVLMEFGIDGNPYLQMSGALTTSYFQPSANKTLLQSVSPGFGAALPLEVTASRLELFNLGGDSLLAADSGGHVIAGGVAASIASGFGTSPAIEGKDVAGRVTVGTGGSATTGVINFGAAWDAAPACTVTNESTVLAMKGIATTTTLTITSTTPFTAGDKITWNCIGY